MTSPSDSAVERLLAIHDGYTSQPPHPGDEFVDGPFEMLAIARVGLKEIQAFGFLSYHSLLAEKPAESDPSYMKWGRLLEETFFPTREYRHAFTLEWKKDQPDACTLEDLRAQFLASVPNFTHQYDLSVISDFALDCNLKLVIHDATLANQQITIDGWKHWKEEAWIYLLNHLVIV